MTKKIFDIIPPGKKNKNKSSVKNGKNYSLSKIVLLGIVVVGLVGTFCYFQFSRAQIKVWPDTKQVEMEKVITVSREATTSDLAKRIIPGEIVSTKVESSGQFTATEISEEKKAKGTIRVFNKSNQPVTLVKNTQLISPSEHVYRANSRIPMPAQQGGQPGHADVEVRAVDTGNEYNVNSTEFSVLKLRGSPLYTKIYAKTISPIKGGMKGKKYKVTEQDLQRAQANLTEQLKKQGRQKIKNKKYNIIPDSITHVATGSFSSAQAGMNTEHFTVQKTIVTEALAFKQDELKQIVKQLIGQQLDHKEVYNPSLNTNFKIEQLDLEQGRVLIRVDFSAKMYAPVNEDRLKQELKGKNLSQVNSWFGQQQEVTRTQINTWPYWMNSIPSDVKRIETKVIID